MSVVNGQPVEASVVNAAFMSRTVDTGTTGKVNLNNTTDPNSGDEIFNAQRAINETFDAVGMTGEGDATRKDYATNNVVSNGESRKEAIEALDAAFDASTGHNHDGSPGNGAPVSADDLADFNRFFAIWQQVAVLGASGTSVDVSTEFTGKTPGGTASTLGVITTPPSNRVALFNNTTLDAIEDAEGQRVYGRVTESSGVWTLSFFTNEAGVETAHNLTLTDVAAFFLEVFDQATRPTIPSSPEFGSLDITADVVDASLTQRGVVSTGIQTFAGTKSFAGDLEAQQKFISQLWTENQGRVSEAWETDSASGVDQTVSSGNSAACILDGALTSISGLTFQDDGSLLCLLNKSGSPVTINHDDPAAAVDERIIVPSGQDVTFPDESIACFRYYGTDQRWRLVSIWGSNFSIGPVLMSPNANGATFNSVTGVFNLAPAASTFPGILTAGAQVISGGKTFEDGVIAESLLRSSDDFEADASVYFDVVDDAVTTGANASLPSPAKAIVRLTNSSLTSINRIQGGAAGRLLVLVNSTGNDFDLLNDAGAPSSDRILCGGGEDLTVPVDGSILLAYEPTGAYWRVIGGAGSGGGGGGAGSLIWVDDAGAAPLAAFDGFRKVFDYAQGDDQRLTATLKIPSSYAPGKQINLKSIFHCPSASGTVLLQTTARLFRPGSSAFNVPLGTRVSTNAAVTMTGANQNQLIGVTFDMSDMTGQVGGQAVQPGDEIAIEVVRAVDTASDAARLAIFSSEVTFK